MKIACLGITMVLLAAPLTHAQNHRQEQGNTKGQFVIFSAGKEQGADNFECVSGIRYLDEMKSLAGEERRMELVYEEGKPKFYRQTSNGLPEFEASIEKDMISFFEGTAMVGGTPLEDQTIVFEPSAYSHYLQILDRYEKLRGSKNSIMVLIPSLQDYIQIQLEHHGSDQLQIEGKKKDIAHYRLAIGKREVINLWADGGNVLALYLASKNQTVVEGSIVHLREQIDGIIKRAL